MGNEFTYYLEYLRELNMISLLVRLFLAVICGGVIGYDRGKHREAAGLRTHILVCVGSACAMLVGAYVYERVGGGIDPARIGAQVISGVGFIGAGTIIFNSRHQVIGVTTAAGLWASAAMGLAAGCGYYECALLMCVLLFLTLHMLNRMDDQFVKKTGAMKVYVECDGDFSFGSAIGVLRKSGWKVSSFENVLNNRPEVCCVQLLLKGEPGRLEKKELLKALRELEGVRYAEEI